MPRLEPGRTLLLDKVQQRLPSSGQMMSAMMSEILDRPSVVLVQRSHFGGCVPEDRCLPGSAGRCFNWSVGIYEKGSSPRPFHATILVIGNPEVESPPRSHSQRCGGRSEGITWQKIVATQSDSHLAGAAPPTPTHTRRGSLVEEWSVARSPSRGTSPEGVLSPQVSPSIGHVRPLLASR